MPGLRWPCFIHRLPRPSGTLASLDTLRRWLALVESRATGAPAHSGQGHLGMELHAQALALSLGSALSIGAFLAKSPPHTLLELLKLNTRAGLRRGLGMESPQGPRWAS